MMRYRKWCKRYGYLAATKGAAKIYAAAREQVPTLPCDEDVRMLISGIAQQLTNVSAAAEAWRTKMNELASTLP